MHPFLSVKVYINDVSSTPPEKWTFNLRVLTISINQLNHYIRTVHTISWCCEHCGRKETGSYNNCYCYYFLSVTIYYIEKLLNYNFFYILTSGS